jgi:SAM-dependent methyltransferase
MGQRHELLSDIWQALLLTGDSVRLGAPQARHDFSAMTEKELASFLGGLHPGALATGRLLAATFDFSTYRTLLDVGGGAGGVSLALTEACSNLQATVVDLPLVTPITRRFVAEANAGGRVRVLTADVVCEPLAGCYDAALMCSLIQTLAAPAARLALANVSSVLKPGGHLYIVGKVLDNSRLSPPETVSVNLVFLNIYEGGQAYTEQEYRAWLAAAGFVAFERFLQPGGTSILRARKPG